VCGQIQQLRVEMHHYACEWGHFSTSISRAIAIARLVPCHHLLKRGPHTSYRPSASSSSANRPPLSSPAPDGIYRPRLIEYDAHAHRAPKCRARTPAAPRSESCTAPPPRSRGGMKHRRRPHHRPKARAFVLLGQRLRPRLGRVRHRLLPRRARADHTPAGMGARAQARRVRAGRSREALCRDGPRGACVAGRGRRVVSAGSARSGACQWPSKSRGQGPDASPVNDPSSVLSHPTRARAVHRLRAQDARAEQAVATASSGCAHTATHAEPCTPTLAMLCMLFASA
jgi:hypothetical protein